MRSAPELAVWIASLSKPGADDGRAAALWHGEDLRRLAVEDNEIEDSPNAAGRFAAWLAELRHDGWITWRFDVWPTDSGEPAPHSFREDHLQRCHQIRLTPEGWRAIPALRPSRVAPLSMGAESKSDEQRDERDVFISHASEDKDAVARPLALELRRRGWTVWFDEFELKLGDGLRGSIDRGLSQSRYGVVVLSPSFFAKNWPTRELDGLVAKEMQSGNKVVLPIWHGVDAEYVGRFSLPLADKLAVDSRLGAAGLAEEIEAVLVSGREPTSLGTTEGTPAPSPIAKPNPVLDAIMAQNEAALREVLRRELAAFAAAIDEILSGRSNDRPTDELVADVGRRLIGPMERLASELLPLVEHEQRLLERELRTLGRRAATRDDAGYGFWNEIRQWTMWWLVHVLGAYAVRREAFSVVRILLTTRYPARAHDVPLAYNFVTDASTAVGLALAPPPQGQTWISPAWEHLVKSVADSATLRDGWPELFEYEDDPRRALGEWSFVASLGLGLAGHASVGFWSISAATALAGSLHEDSKLRGKLAEEAYDLTLEELDARAGEALEHSRALGSFGERRAAEIFLDGQWRSG